MHVKPNNIAPIAIVFELLLGLAGAALARWRGIPLESKLQISTDHLLRGLVATGPMLVLLAWVAWSNWPPLVQLRRQVESLVRQLFAESTWWQLALVAAAAGIGEELLFRGALQPIVARWTTPLAGLIAVSLLFGLLHAASPAYFVFATLVGAYLGWMTQQYDDLVAPIVTHTVYDFAALWWLRKRAID